MSRRVPWITQNRTELFMANESSSTPATTSSTSVPLTPITAIMTLSRRTEPPSLRTSYTSSSPSSPPTARKLPQGERAKVCAPKSSSAVASRSISLWAESEDPPPSARRYRAIFPRGSPPIPDTTPGTPGTPGGRWLRTATSVAPPGPAPTQTESAVWLW